MYNFSRNFSASVKLTELQKRFWPIPQDVTHTEVILHLNSENELYISSKSHDQLQRLFIPNHSVRLAELHSDGVLEILNAELAIQQVLEDLWVSGANYLVDVKKDGIAQACRIDLAFRSQIEVETYIKSINQSYKLWDVRHEIMQLNPDFFK